MTAYYYIVVVTPIIITSFYNITATLGCLSSALVNQISTKKCITLSMSLTCAKLCMLVGSAAMLSDIEVDA